MKRGSGCYTVTLNEFERGVPGVTRADVHRDGQLTASFAYANGEEPGALEALRRHLEGPRLRIVKGGAS